MIRVCPDKHVWFNIYKKLKGKSIEDPAIPPPPINLILAGWAFSDDFEKKNQWQKTLSWIEKYGGNEYIVNLTDKDYYIVNELSRSAFFDYQWGESSPSAQKPSEEQLSEYIEKIKKKWTQIANKDASFTEPITFSGTKARCLIVEYRPEELPSWGTWGNDPGGYHLQKFTDKAAFSLLRQKINETIHPHKVDHVVFQKRK